MSEPLRIRSYELGRDYPEICEWWRAREWPAVPANRLPMNGVIAEDAAGTKHAAVFFYVVEGAWAWLDYLVTNPAAPLRRKPEAIELVVESSVRTIRAVKQAAGEDGYSIMTCLDNENLIEIFERHGFRQGDQKMTTLVCGGSFL